MRGTVAETPRPSMCMMCSNESSPSNRAQRLVKPEKKKRLALLQPGLPRPSASSSGHQMSRGGSAKLAASPPSVTAPQASSAAPSQPNAPISSAVRSTFHLILNGSSQLAPTLVAVGRRTYSEKCQAGSELPNPPVAGPAAICTWTA